MEHPLDGQVAVVTGGGRGFGRAIAEGLAAAGAAVTVTARSRSELQDTVAAIEQAGGAALAIAGDVTNRQDIERVQRETEARLGPVTLLVHSAAVPWPFGPVWHVDPERWWQAQAVHVLGAMLCIKAFVPGMVERGRGRMIIVASAAGTVARPNLSGYATGKATQIRLVEHLALEGKEHSVYAFVIHPGDVVTNLSELTMADPDAQKYLPSFVANLTRRKAAGEDPLPGLKRCAAMCVELASGRCDALSGRYLRPEDDLERLARAAELAPAHQGAG